MQELTIKDIFRIIRKWLALIIIVPIITAAVAAIYFYRYVPDTYEANTTLYVLRTYETPTTSSANSGYDWTTSAQLVADYQVLIQQEPVTERAIALLGTGNKLEAEIKVSAGSSVTGSSSSRFMYITATGTNPVVCANTANAITEAFINYLKESNLLETPINIITKAEVPELPSGPARLRNVCIAMLIGLMLAVGIAFAAELLNTTIRSEADAVKFLELPVLANVISYQTEMSAYYREAGKRSRELYASVSGLTKESIKALAANIQFSGINKPLKTIMITSTIPKEGKSSATAMLASAMAEEGKRVLIVDIDYRNPTIGRLFFMRNRWDLVDYLSGRQELRNIIANVPGTSIYFIDAIHKAGISTNMLKMDAFDGFIDAVKNSFDVVLFDTSPIGIFIDAAILSNKVDACVVVVGTGMVDRQNILDSIEQLHKANANVIGTVLNFVDSRQHSYYGYRTYRYGSYHSDIQYGSDNNNRRKGN